MSRALNDLAEVFRPKAIELLARLTEAGIPVMVINTLRTDEQQKLNIANGVSWIQHSKHQDGLAIDICPYEMYQQEGPNKLDWDSTHPIWQSIGRIGKNLNLIWGGDWKQKDMGHFELKEG